jgi:predicted NBD/HSP70 family sugar kinase
VVAAAAAAGDRSANRILARLTEQLARGLATVVCVLNPATVILGGEIALLGPALVDSLRQGVAALVPRPPRHFVASSLGGDGVALGAVQVALQEAETRLLDLPLRRAA